MISSLEPFDRVFRPRVAALGRAPQRCAGASLERTSERLFSPTLEDAML
jgi:hypothetical protein